LGYNSDCLKINVLIFESKPAMRSQFTLEYWQDGAWYIGRLLEVPGVCSQGATLEELQENM